MPVTGSPLPLLGPFTIMSVKCELFLKLWTGLNVCLMSVQCELFLKLWTSLNMICPLKYRWPLNFSFHFMKTSLEKIFPKLQMVQKTFGESYSLMLKFKLLWTSSRWAEQRIYYHYVLKLTSVFCLFWQDIHKHLMLHMWPCIKQKSANSNPQLVS